eukprot:6199467-Amphidinium_carterae.1
MLANTSLRLFHRFHLQAALAVDAADLHTSQGQPKRCQSVWSAGAATDAVPDAATVSDDFVSAQVPTKWHDDKTRRKASVPKSSMPHHCLCGRAVRHRDQHSIAMLSGSSAL